MHDFRIGALGVESHTYPAYSHVNYTTKWVYSREGVIKDMYIKLSLM